MIKKFKNNKYIVWTRENPDGSVFLLVEDAADEHMVGYELVESFMLNNIALHGSVNGPVVVSAYDLFLDAVEMELT